MKKINIDINNREKIYEFLHKKLLQNTTFKGKYFYKLIIKLYDKYPKFTKNFINNLNEVMYYKTYFYILEYSKDDSSELNKQIYSILIKKYKEDIKYFREKEYNKLSTLTKWLPRKNKKFDKLYNFVKKFTKLVYPNIHSQPAEKIYRKTISDISKNIGILERELCAKTLENINFNKLTYRNFLCNYTKLWSLPEKMEQYIINRNSKIRYLVKRLLYIIDSKNKSTYDRELIILNNIWKKKYESFIVKYKKKIPLDNILVIDLSNRIYNNMKWQLIAIYLMGLYNNNFVIINKKNPIKIIKQELLEENINQLIINISTIDKIDINKIDNIDNKNKIILTDKELKTNHIILKLYDVKLQKKNNNYIGNPFYFLDIAKKYKVEKLLNYGELKTNNYKYIIISIFVIIYFIYIFLNSFL